MRLYIAGGMTGLPDYNFPAFDVAFEYLNRLGHLPCSPANHDREVLGVPFGDQPTDEQLASINIREALEWDLTWICRHAEGIAVLAGWEASSGARAEVSLGLALGIPVMHWRCVTPAHGGGRGYLAGRDRITTLPPDPRLAVVELPEAGVRPEDWRTVPARPA